MMILTFSTGEQRLFDAAILTGKAFSPLSDENIFKNCKVVDGVVTWLDEEIDCAPEYMYTNSSSCYYLPVMIDFQFLPDISPY